MPKLALVKWGQGYSNTLTFAYPPEPIRCWSAPREGSTRDRSDGGVEDMWLVGKDYFLAGAFRWLNNRDVTGASGYDGPTGVRAALDWAHRGNQIRFAPDASNSDNYLTCDVVEPWDAPPDVERDTTHIVTFVLRTIERPFTQAIAGLLWEFKAGMQLEDFNGVFTRNSTGTYVGADGFLKTAAVDEARMEWLDVDNDGTVDTLSLLMEEARTNLCIRSQELDHAAWTASNCTVTPNAAIAPDGTLTAEKIAENTANANHYVLGPNMTIVSGGVYTISVFFKAAERYRMDIRLFDPTLTDGFGVSYDSQAFTTSTTLTGAGTVVTGSVKYRKLKNGWSRISVTGAVNGGRTTAAVFMEVEDNAGTTVYAGTAGLGAYFWGVQVEAGYGVTSYIPTTSASVQRQIDVLYFSPVRLPMTAAITFYAKMARPYWADIGGAIPERYVFAYNDDPSVVNPAIILYAIQPSRSFAAASYGLGAATSSSQGAAIPAGASLEVVGNYSALTGTAPKANIDVGAGYVGDASGSKDFGPAWPTEKLYLGCFSNGLQFNGNLIAAKLSLGTKTLAQMAAL